MKVYRRFFAALAALILCLSMPASAWAADAAEPADAAPAETVEETAAPIEADDSGEISFENKRWIRC